jgi:hypothetical protein
LDRTEFLDYRREVGRWYEDSLAHARRDLEQRRARLPVDQWEALAQRALDYQQHLYREAQRQRLLLEQRLMAQWAEALDPRETPFLRLVKQGRKGVPPLERWRQEWPVPEGVVLKQESAVGLSRHFARPHTPPQLRLSFPLQSEPVLSPSAQMDWEVRFPRRVELGQ